MATLYVRNFPDALYQSIQDLAGEEKHSISAEVIELVADAVARQQRKHRRLAAMARIESRYDRFHLSADSKDSVELLREDRDR